MGLFNKKEEPELTEEERKEQEERRAKSRSTIWAIAGVYLLYLAYKMVADAYEEGAVTVFVAVFAVFFAAVGVWMLWNVLRFYLVKTKENQELDKEAADAEKTASEEKPAQPEIQPDTRPSLSCKVVILAAGKGTRMHSDLPKVLHEIDGRPMALYVKEAAMEAGAQVVCYVIGYQRDRVRIALADRGVTFAVQEEQLGTGHAVKCAKNFIGTQGDVFVLCGDTPLITGETLSKLLERHRMQGNAVTALSAVLDNPYGYGRIIRDADGTFRKSVEEKDATEEERAVKESNVGMYVFRAADLSEAVELLDNNNAQGEYYLPDTLMILQAQGKKVDAYCIENTPEILGVNTPQQLEYAARVLYEREHI